MKPRELPDAIGGIFGYTEGMKSSLIVVALVVALGLTAMVVKQWSLRTETTTLRLGINPWPGYEALFLADQYGLFRKHGLDVRLVEFTSVGDCLRGYQEGNIDAMASTLVEVALAEASSSIGKPVPVLVTDASYGADMILARETFSRMADLKGARIGVEPASLGIFILDRALAMNGMKRDDVILVPMGQEEMRHALASQAVSAVVTYSPYSVAISKDGARVIFTTREIPDEVIDVVSVNPEMLAKQPGMAAGIRAAWADAMSLIESEREQSIAVMAARQRITPSEFIASLDGLTLIASKRQEELLSSSGQVQKSLVGVRNVLDAADAR